MARVFLNVHCGAMTGSEVGLALGHLRRRPAVSRRVQDFFCWPIPELVGQPVHRFRGAALLLRELVCLVLCEGMYPFPQN